MRSPAIGSRYWATLAFLLSPALFYVYLPTFVWLSQQWLGVGPFVWETRYWTYAPPVTRYWTHGPLVVLLIGYLLWRHRRGFYSARPSFWGLPLIQGGMGLHLAAVFLEAPYLSAVSLIPVSLGVVCWLFGTSATSRLLVPFLLFLLAVPFPVIEWGVIRWLAQVVAITSAFLAKLGGAPIFRSGQLITVGQDAYLIEARCSGFSLIVALLALMAPFLYLRGASLRSLGGALLWLPALGLATKVVLVSTVLVLTPWLGQNTALTLYHSWLGILFYLASLGAAILAIFVFEKTRPASLVSLQPE